MNVWPVLLAAVSSFLLGGLTVQFVLFGLILGLWH